MQDRSTAGYGIGVFPSLAVDLLGWGMLWSTKKFAYLQVGNDLCLGLVNRNGPRRVLSY